MYKLSNSVSFNSWIAQFQKEKSDRGIFARWFVDREGNGYATTRPITKRSFLEVLKKKNSNQFLTQTFEELWIKFEKIPHAITAHGVKIKIEVPRI